MPTFRQLLEFGVYTPIDAVKETYTTLDTAATGALDAGFPVTIRDLIHAIPGSPTEVTVIDDEERGAEQVTMIHPSVAALDKQNFSQMFKGMRRTSGTPVNYAEGMFHELYDGGVSHDGVEKAIFAPFSTYMPSALWPYTDNTGGRYTVHDFGNEELTGDWIGVKPIIEQISGRKLNRVGALPAYRYWGDMALGALSVAFLLGVAFVAANVIPITTPPLVKSLIF